MADLGQKHECPECGAKFYDLGKSDPVCPRCGSPVGEGDDEPRAPKTRRKRRPPAPVKVRVAEDEIAAVEDDEEIEGGDEDFEVLDAEDIEDEEIADLDEDEEEDADEEEAEV